MSTAIVLKLVALSVQAASAGAVTVLMVPSATTEAMFATGSFLFQQKRSRSTNDDHLGEDPAERGVRMK